ncbi:MAG: YceI family protein [Alphaproteobacteria bacterium]
MRFIPALLGVAIMAGFAGPASAEKFILDKPHTQIIFKVNHMGFSHSFGKFTDYAGEINYDETDPAKSNADVTIQTSSLDLDDDKWNEHMKSKDFFDVEKFPTMTFKSTGIEKTGDKTANITGDLTLLGVTKPVTLAVQQNNMGKHPMKSISATGFSATGKIKRSDFGMSGGIPMVSDEVDLIIEVEAYGEDKSVGNN